MLAARARTDQPIDRAQDPWPVPVCTRKEILQLPAPGKTQTDCTARAQRRGLPQPEVPASFPERETRQSIIVGIQLPVQDVFGRSDIKGVAEDGRAAVQRGAQLDNLWTKGYRFFIPVASPVIQRNLYSHPPSCGPRLESGDRHHSAPQPADSTYSSWKLRCKDKLTH